jgi:hypothetical protein
MFAIEYSPTDEAVSPDWYGILSDWDGWSFAYEVSEDGDQPFEPTFQWSPCESCGSGLGGDRYRYVAIQTKTRENA